MRILIYGAGGVGLYFAIRLARSGAQVVLKGRPETVHQSRESPVKLIRDGDIENTFDIEVVDRIDGRRFDAAIIATKAWQVAEAALAIAPTLMPAAPVLTTQNGVDAPDRASESIPTEHVLAASLVVIVKRIGPLKVELIGPEASLTMGSLHDPAPSVAAEQFRDTIEKAAMEVSWTTDIRSALWKKLALISSYGGVGALSDATVGQTRAIPETRALVVRAACEVVELANRSGAHLGEADLRDVLDIYEQRFSPETTSSMHRDLIEGRPSELHDQNGAVVAHATRIGMSVPIQEAIYAALLPREIAARENRR